MQPILSTAPPQWAPCEVDPAYFFAGDVPTYGQHLNPDEVTTLAYLRAMRRIDRVAC